MFRNLMLAAAGLLIAACSPKAPAPGAAGGPEAVVQAIYAPYMGAESNQPTWRDAVPWSDSMKALLAQEAAAATPGEMGAFDADPIIAAQDYQLSNLRVTTAAPPAGGKAVVDARFTNMSTDTLVHYDMVEEGGAWKVDNIRSNNGGIPMDMREAVARFLAPPDDSPSDKAVECIAYLDLARDGISRGQLQGDAQLMAAASRNYYAVARQTLSEDEYAQYRASSIAVFDDTAPAELLVKANACVAGATSALPTPAAAPSSH
jgi:hypothetical protein